MRLSVVMPAYNEEAAINSVAREWIEALERLGIDYEIRIYNDGSTDGTLARLRDFARRHPAVVVIDKPNEGHGPTILRGYAEAEGDWVFQIDSDGEMGAASFDELWSRRDGFDLLLGVRQDRESALVRRLISFIAWLTVRLLFGQGIGDVNAPYRLIRRERLVELLRAVPPRARAPNVILSGLAARRGLRLYEHPVPYRARRGGKTSLVKLRLWKLALGAFRETVGAARVALREPQGGPEHGRRAARAERRAGSRGT